METSQTFYFSVPLCSNILFYDTESTYGFTNTFIKKEEKGHKCLQWLYMCDTDGSLLIEHKLSRQLEVRHQPGSVS